MLAYVFLLYFLIASTFTLSKSLVTVFSPLFLVTLRFLLGGGLLLFGSLFWHPKEIVNIKKQDYKDFLKVALALYCFGFTLDNYAIVFIKSSFSSLIYNLSPFFTAIMAYFIFKRALSLSQLIGLVIGFLSVSVPFFRDIFSDFFGESCHSLSLIIGAYIMLIIAVIANAYGWIIFEKLLEKGYSSTTIHCIGLLGSGILNIGLIFFSDLFDIHFFECGQEPPMTVLGSPILDLFVLVIVSHVVCALLYGNLLKTFSSTFISFAGCITPLFVALFGFIFLNEHVTLQFFFATLGVSLGLFIFYKNESKKGIYSDS